ncbi:hypothetical protein LBMAG27_19160 [Bacteroidota bacterium]|nr:hypothetical protein LBMAG27_19160 [Bacteroidota bacterium]
MKLKYFFLFINLFITTRVFATHIIGGEITYKYLGNNNYKITLKVYRDCNTGQAPFDDPAVLGVFNSQGSLLSTINLGNPIITYIQPTLNNPCITTPPDICVEQAIYSSNQSLPPISGGYQIVYQRCCRNGSIINILDPGNVGSTYIAKIPDVSVFGYNSSPYFNNYPPIAICEGMPLVFDHSATDPDGDVLVYSFCTPYEGATAGNPMPQPPNGPPYGTVAWVSPYNVNNQISSTPQMAINASTGLLTANPDAVGQFVVGVCVKEYRNGVLLGEDRRDFQFNVTLCNPVVEAKFKTSIGNQDTVLACGQLTIAFNNISIGAQNFIWDFGDLTTTLDHSTLQQPSYTYPGVGNYTVTLIVNQGLPCGDTAIKVVSIHNPIQTFFSVDTVCALSPTNFNDESVTLEGFMSSWKWNFDDGNNSLLQSPSYNYQQGGIYNVTLISANNFGCKDTITKPVLVYSLPIPNAGPDTMICDIDSLHLFAENGINYSWSPNYNLSNVNISNPMAQPDVNTTYIVTVTDAHNCVNIDSAIILVVDTVISVAGPDTTICLNQPLQLFSSNAVYYQWEPASLTSNPDVIAPFVYPQTNTTFTVTSFIGSCFDIDSVTVNVNPIPVPNAGLGGTINQGEKIQLQGSGGGTYLWTPPQDLSDPTTDWPIAFPLNTTTYTMTLTNEFGCIASDTLVVIVTHIHELYVPNAFTPNGDGTNDFFLYFTRGIRKINELKIYNRWGQIVYSNNGYDETPWNGTSPKGLTSPMGVYVYYIVAETYDGDLITKIGNITLLR